MFYRICVSAPLWLCEDAGLIESNAAGFLTTEAQRHRAKIIRLCALVVKIVFRGVHMHFLDL